MEAAATSAPEKVGQVKLEDPDSTKEKRKPSKRRTNRLHAQHLVQEETTCFLGLCEEGGGAGIAMPNMVDCATVEVREHCSEAEDPEHQAEGRGIIHGFLCGQPPSLPCHMAL